MPFRTLAISCALLLASACKKHIPDPAVRAYDASPRAGDGQAAVTPAQAMARNFERVYFDFDSAQLDTSTQGALRENVAIMQRYPDVRVEVQGHCDERGSTDYNLALGQKRTAAIRRHMVESGLAASRIATVSLGEEHPLEGGTGETVWARNRRAEFRITGGADLALGTTP